MSEALTGASDMWELASRGGPVMAALIGFSLLGAQSVQTLNRFPAGRQNQNF